MSSIPRSLPSAVAPSTGSDNVDILTAPQLGPHQPQTGSAINPVVPRTAVDGVPGDQPSYGYAAGTGGQLNAGSAGAPSLPQNGFLFTARPVDSHYMNTNEVRNPYAKVNNPPTKGWYTIVKSFMNHIALTPQEVNPNGFRNSPAQQRTSVMRVTLPPDAGGYGTETYTPRQVPQASNVYKYNPSTGTQAYGTGVLNSDTYGAGQVAGGIGGSNYTPAPGPPSTNAISNPPDTSGMPVWG